MDTGNKGYSNVRGEKNCDLSRERSLRYPFEWMRTHEAAIPGGGGGGGGGGYSPKIPIRVCAAQRGRDFGTPYLERGIHFRDVS